MLTEPSQVSGEGPRKGEQQAAPNLCRSHSDCPVVEVLFSEQVQLLTRCFC
jgi:hypothetical protein